MEQPADVRDSIISSLNLLGLELGEVDPENLLSFRDSKPEFAIRALSRLHPASFVQDMLQSVLWPGVENHELQRIALEQCSKLKPQKLDLPASVVFSEIQNIRLLALNCLAAQRGKGANSQLREVIIAVATTKKSALSELSAAASALARMQPKEGRELGGWLIQHPDVNPEFLKRMIAELVEVGPNFAPLLVLDLVGHDDDSVRNFALTSGYAVLPPRASERIATLVMRNSEESFGNRVAAARMLLDASPEVVLDAMALTRE
jgi:hypothetical protein